MGINLPIHKVRSIHWIARLLVPAFSRLPFRWVYPVGKNQENRKPTAVEHFEQAGIILGDCHYIWRYMPECMVGKTIITNTTTADDIATFRASGVRYLATTTPVYDGRSFGTNMMEAAILAATRRSDPVDYASPNGYFQWIEERLDELCMDVQIQELNP
jgi:hypothetical protein